MNRTRRFRGCRVWAVLCVFVSWLHAAPHALVEEGEQQWQVVDPAAAPVRNLSLPVQQHPDGSTKIRLQASQAWIPPSGWIRATNVVVELFSPDGAKETILTTQRTLYDRRRELAVCLGRVRFEHPSIRIDGVDALWMSKPNTISIFSDARVELPPNERRWMRTGERP